MWAGCVRHPSTAPTSLYFYFEWLGVILGFIEREGVVSSSISAKVGTIFLSNASVEHFSQSYFLVIFYSLVERCFRENLSVDLDVKMS
jgi:hypothetical protein